MLGGRHIETAAWKAPGKWLDSSGWTAALVQDDIATPGKADSFKGVYPEQDMHTRSQLQHFTLCCERLTHHNYVEEHNDLADNFDEWRQLREDENPQFKFWSLTLEIQ